MPENKTRISFYLKKDTIRVYTSALRALDKPRFVRFLINPNTLKMAMTEYGQKEFTSFRVSRKIFEDSKDKSLRLSSKKFCTLIANRMNWDTEKSYWVEGRIYPEQKIVIYDLTSAKEIVLGKSHHKRRKAKTSPKRKTLNTSDD